MMNEDYKLDTMANICYHKVKYHVEEMIKYASKEYNEFLNEEQQAIMRKIVDEVTEFRASAEVSFSKLFPGYSYKRIGKISDYVSSKLEKYIRNNYEGEFGNHYLYIQQELHSLEDKSDASLYKKCRELQEELIDKVDRFNPFTKTYSNQKYGHQ